MNATSYETAGRIFGAIPFRWQALLIALAVLAYLLWRRSRSGASAPGDLAAGRQTITVTAKTEGPGVREDDPEGKKAKELRDALARLPKPKPKAGE